MSTLVVVKKNGYATIACDSLSTDGSITVCPENKINNHKFFKHGDSFIGLVGWSNFNDILENILKDDSADLEFANRSAIFNSLIYIHQKMKDEYFIETSENDDQPVESSQMDGLVISPHGIFEFDSYRGVDEYSKYWALGSGRRFALGALYSAYDSEQTSEEIAITAVKASCSFDDGSALPVLFETIELKNV
jgi:ATP-dependent protease HslVU (ClpYQ) peptidase subunit